MKKRTLIASALLLIMSNSPVFSFTLLGTAWAPGANTSRSGGNPAPGGATWSILGAGLVGTAGNADDPHDSNVTVDLSDLYVGGVNDEIATIGITLDKWAAVSGYTNLGQVADGGGNFGDPTTGLNGDIRVGSIFIDGGTGSNVLAHAYGPGTEASFFSNNFDWNLGGDTHFDNGNSWSDGGAGIDFHTVALHEFGHALGLGHSLVVGSVMEATYAGVRRELHADDIAGIQAIYGVAVPEPSSLVLLGLSGLALLRRRRV